MYVLLVGGTGVNQRLAAVATATLALLGAACGYEVHLEFVNLTGEPVRLTVVQPYRYGEPREFRQPVDAAQVAPGQVAMWYDYGPGRVDGQLLAHDDGGRLVREWPLVVASEDAETCRITLTDDEQLQCEQLTRPRDHFVVRNDGSVAVDVWYRDEYFGRLAPGHRLSHMLIREGDRTAVIRLLDAAGNERVNVDLVAFTAEHRRGPIVVTSDGVTRECPSR